MSGTTPTRAHVLDVRKTLKVYIKRTKDIRKGSQLFCCYGGGKAGVSASKQTILPFVWGMYTKGYLPLRD